MSQLPMPVREFAMWFTSTPSGARLAEVASGSGTPYAVRLEATATGGVPHREGRAPTH